MPLCSNNGRRRHHEITMPIRLAHHNCVSLTPPILLMPDFLQPGDSCAVLGLGNGDVPQALCGVAPWQLAQWVNVPIRCESQVQS